MCKPIRDGGRRCPIHMHQNIAAIKVSAKNSGLTRYQVERLFSELTREGRRAEVPSPAELQLTRNRVINVGSQLDMTEEVEEELRKANQHDRDLDGPSAYAQKLIIHRSGERANALEKLFNETSRRTGLSAAEVEAVYKKALRQGVRERGGEYPEEYNPNTRRAAVNANLPYDVASVVAIERVKKLEADQETQQRITLTEHPGSSFVAKSGYDNGRMEIVLSGSNAAYHAYRNVPEHLWNEFKNAESPYTVYATKIAGRAEFQYDTAEEAARDGLSYKCASCGQFANQSHSCPERTVRAELAKTLPAEKVAEALKEIVGEKAPMEATTPEEAAPEAVEETPDQDPATAVPAEKVTPVAVAEAQPVELDIDTWDPKTDPTSPNVTVDFGSEDAIAFDKKTPDVTTLKYQLKPEAVTTAVWDPTQDNIAPGRWFATNDRYSSYWVSRLPEDMRKKIEEAAKDNVSFLVRTGVEEEPSLVKAFDNRYFEAEVNYGARAVLHRAKLPKIAQDIEAGAIVDSVDESYQAETVLNRLLAHDDVAIIDPIATVSKRTGADATAQQRTAPKARIGDIRQIKAAFKEGKAVAVPAYMEFTGGSRHLDDQGHSIVNAGGGSISGKMVFRQNKNGAVELISSPRSLKCSCYTYRRNYRCVHIGYAVRHFPNIVAQASVPSVRAAASTDPEERRRIRLLGNLTARDDVSLATTKDGEPYISFSATVGDEATYESGWNTRQRVTTPVEMRNRTLEFDDLIEVSRLHRLATRISSFNSPARMAQVRAALKRGNLEMPVRAEFRRGTFPGAEDDNQAGVVTGSIIYNKTDDPNNATVKENRLQCTCDVYQRNYSCVHTRFLEGQPSIMLQVRARGDVPNTLARTMMNYSEELSSATSIQQLMIRENLSREEATRRVEELAEAERVARAEREARWEETRRREAMQASERRRLEAEEREKINKETVATTTAYVNEMMQKWQNVEGRYQDNPDAFYNDVEAALSRKAKGESPIVYRTENVTDGMAAPVEGARRFGIELEFDLPDVANRQRALSNIAEDLYAAGLTGVNYQQGYHSAQGSWEKWSFEQDMTVAGEVVSPILSDTPETWNEIRQVLEIVRKHGGSASARTGSHVHVSTASYGSSTAKNAQLLRDTNADEDMLYRLASNPKTGKHRGTQWCGPNVDDNEGDIPADRLDGHAVLRPIAYNNHNIAVNFGGATNSQYKKNHVEFRHWDGTLDEAVIQQQIIASLGMVDRAERTVIESGGTKKERRARIHLGTNKDKEANVRGGTTSRRKLTKDEFHEVNSDAKDFIDSLVRRPEDRAGLAALFAVTKWQN